MTLSKKDQAAKKKAAEAAKEREPEVTIGAPKKVAKKKFPLSIAPGRSMTCKKGIIGPGEEVKREYFTGEDKEVAAMIVAHIKSGCIVEA